MGGSTTTGAPPPTSSWPWWTVSPGSAASASPAGDRAARVGRVRDRAVPVALQDGLHRAAAVRKGELRVRPDEPLRRPVGRAGGVLRGRGVRGDLRGGAGGSAARSPEPP